MDLLKQRAFTRLHLCFLLATRGSDVSKLILESSALLSVESEHPKGLKSNFVTSSLINKLQEHPRDKENICFKKEINLRIW